MLIVTLGPQFGLHGANGGRQDVSTIGFVTDVPAIGEVGMPPFRSRRGHGGVIVELTHGAARYRRLNVLANTPVSAGRPVIELRDVHVSHDGERRALDAVTWRVHADERWVVIGPNGCGKSTLVSVITGWLHASGGSVRLLGAALGEGVDWRRHRTHIGVVSAAFSRQVRRELIAADVVMTAKYGALETWWHEYSDEDRARARSLLTDAGMEHIADREFGVLSEGERQQVQIARALMVPPALLVLDEPAAGLDLGNRERLVRRIAALAADPAVAPMVLVTHHLEEIPVAFTHAMCLRGGRVVASGPIHEVLRDEVVSATFGIDVAVRHDAGRWAATVR
jgi:iron complex transport system ATP-binding protein